MIKIGQVFREINSELLIVLTLGGSRGTNPRSVAQVGFARFGDEPPG